MGSPPKLWTTQALCAAVQDLASTMNPPRKTDTPYGLAKFLQADQNTAAEWLRGNRVMSDDWAEKIADLLGEDRAWVTLCLAVERTKDDDLSAEMAAILLRLPNHAASVFLGVFALLPALLGQPGIA